MRLSPAIVLSALLIGSIGYTQDIDVGDGKNVTQTLSNGTTIDKITLQGSGQLTVDSSGNNTITKMQMFWLKDGASATFNVNSGNLNLNLGINNIDFSTNSVNLNVSANSKLTLTSGVNGTGRGVFLGSNTTLKATINGTLDGGLSNDGASNITINRDGMILGDITQTGKTLTAIIEGKLDGNITSTSGVTRTELWANKDPLAQNATVTGNISIEGGDLAGIMERFTLEGSYAQTGGNSDIAFHHSVFNSSTTLNDAQTLIHFYSTNLKSISSTNGTTTINLKGDIKTGQQGSTMQDFAGIGGTSTITLIQDSSMKSASQSSGTLTIDARNSTLDGSATGSNQATLNISLQSSTVKGSLSNSMGITNITSSNTSKITGSISQTGGSLQATLTDTTIEGSFSQNGGALASLRATNSTIEQGIILSSVAPNGISPQIILDHTTIKGGIKTQTINTVLTGQILNGSVIDGGFDQTRRERVAFEFSASTLNDGVQVRDGGNITGNISSPQSHATILEFDNGSTLNGGVTVNNHSIWVEFDGSTEDGAITITGGDAVVRGVNSSRINGDLTSQGTNNTNLSLDNSTFTGSITQTGGNQNLKALNDSKIIGNIQNNDTNTTFELRSNSELEGSYTQNNGTLDWILGGSAIVHNDIVLNNVTTTLSNGNAIDRLETFKGNFTQNDGTLQGTLGGLTLEGAFTQNNGVTNITFESANFQRETKLNNPTQTNILFDNNSQLKTTTLSGSLNADNTFILDHTTTLDGDFILINSKVTLGVKNASKITGNIKSDDANSDLKLDFEGAGNEIGGSIEINNGNLDGNINGTTIGNGIKLTDVTTHLHIIDSTINQGINILRGYTLMTIDHSNINGDFTMSGVDKNGRTPTLGLSINNSSTIDGDLKFDNTNATLGGFGDNNSITGSLISENSTLVTGGDDFAQAGHEPTPTSISGMTIAGEVKQNGGTLNLTFSNKSDIQDQTTLSQGVQSYLTLQDSKMGGLEIIEGNDNLVSLENASELDGNVALTSTNATIQALNQSNIIGNILATANPPASSTSNILLDNSGLTGGISQNNGILNTEYSNNSTMVGNFDLSNLTLSAKLNQSAINGDLNVTNSQATISLSNNSSINGNLNLNNNPNFTLNASASTLQGNITHQGLFGNGEEIQLNFSNGSTLDNIDTSISGDMLINSTSSQINSTGAIDLVMGTLRIVLDNSTGTIQNLHTAGSNSITILTRNNSNSTINQISISDSASISITGESRAILNGTLTLQDQAKATITSLSNANLKLNIIATPTNTLNIILNGGMLEGTLTQPIPYTGSMTLANSGGLGGRWIATGDSFINNLNITNSSGNIENEALMQQDTYNTPINLVDTTRDAGGTSRIGMTIVKIGANPLFGETNERVVRINNLSGLNGVFRVYTDIGAEASDKISIANASGNHTVQVYYNPSTFTTDIGNRYIVVAHVDDDQTTANFEGGTTQVGTQSYKTDLTKVTSPNGGVDWILGKTQSGGANYGTKVISSILQSQYRSYILQTESLRQRMGELRDINRVHGLWGRYSMGSTYTPESKEGVEIEDYYYTAWVGYDQNVLDLKGQDFYGFALSYSYVNPQGKDYEGQIHNIGFNFYNTFIARNDFYVDLVLKYILTQSSYEISYYNLAPNTPSYTNHKLMFNAEIGKKFKLNDSKSYFFLQPDAQITVGYIFGNELPFVDLSQTTINSSISGTAPVIIRTGLTAGYSLNYGLKSDFYVGTSFFYETTGGGSVNLDDSNNQVSYDHNGGFKMTLQGGFDILFTDNARVYFEAGTSFMGTTKTTYSINAGARFAFGYKNTRKLKAPPLTPPREPKKPEYDPRNIPVITDYTTEDIRVNNSATPKTPQGYDSDYFINTRKFYRDKSSVTNNPKPKY